MGEAIAGLAKNKRNIFYLTLGTGVGGAWMLDRKLYFGAHGSAGEIRHTIINSIREKFGRAKNIIRMRLYS